MTDKFLRGEREQLTKDSEFLGGYQYRNLGCGPLWNTGNGVRNSESVCRHLQGLEGIHGEVSEIISLSSHVYHDILCLFFFASTSVNSR